MRQTIKMLLAVGAAVAISSQINAADYHGPYRADVKSVYDGDTFHAEVHAWPGQVQEVAVRVRGVDTPEIHGKCQSEKDMAQAAKKFAEQKLASGPVELLDITEDKYAGRIDATVMINGHDLALELIQAGLGREYHGGKRQGWCQP